MEDLLRIIIISNLCLLMFTIDVSCSSAKFLVVPRLTIAETYNDNLFLEDDSPDSDWITTIAPGLDASFDSNYLRMDLDYALNFITYKYHPEEDENSFRDAQRAQLEALFLPERDFTLALREEVSRVSIDDRAPAVLENELVNKTTLYRFTANPQYRWRALPTFETIFGYRYDDYDYVDPEGDDARGHQYSLSLVKGLGPGTKVMINGFGEDYRSGTWNGYLLQRVSAGLSQQVGARWLVEAEGGHAWVDLDMEPEIGNSSEREIGDSVWMASLTGRIAKYAEFILGTTRAFSVSVDSGLTSRTEATAVLQYRNVLDVELEAYWRENDYRTEERTDRSFGYLLTAAVPLSRRIVVRGRGDVGFYDFYDFNDILPEHDKVLRFGSGASVEYVGNRGSLSLNYTFRVSDSNNDRNDYVNNITTVSGSLRF
jgi:hypothetical protein